MWEHVGTQPNHKEEASGSFLSGRDGRMYWRSFDDGVGGTLSVPRSALCGGWGRSNKDTKGKDTLDCVVGSWPCLGLRLEKDNRQKLGRGS